MEIKTMNTVFATIKESKQQKTRFSVTKEVSLLT